MKISNETIAKLTAKELNELGGKELGFDIIPEETKDIVVKEIMKVSSKSLKEKSQLVMVSHNPDIYKFVKTEEYDNIGCYIVVTSDNELVFRIHKKDSDCYVSIDKLFENLLNTLAEIIYNSV